MTRLFAGLYVLGFVMLISGGFLYFQTGPTFLNTLTTAGQPCTLSAIQAYNITCGINPGQTYLDSFLYTTTSTSDSGIWGGGAVAQQGGFIKAFYFTASGASVRSWSMFYNIGNGQVPMSVSLGSDPNTGQGGLNWIGGNVPNAALPQGVTTTFYAELTDTFGNTVQLSAQFTYTGTQIFPIHFKVNDITNQISQGQTKALANQQIRIIETDTGDVVGQVVTDGSGQASLSLPGTSYSAQLTTPNGYAVIPPQAFSLPGASGSTLTFNTYTAQTCAVLGQTNCYPPCGSNLPNAVQTCLSQTITSTVSSSLVCTSVEVGANPGVTCVTTVPYSTQDTTSSSCGTFSTVITQTQVHTTNLVIGVISNTITTTTTSVNVVPCFFNGQGPNQLIGLVLAVAGFFELIVTAAVDRRPASQRG